MYRMRRSTKSGYILLCMSLCIYILWSLWLQGLSIFMLWLLSALAVAGLVLVLGIDISIWNLVRSSHPRWVYISSVIVLLCLWIFKWFSHDRLLIVSLCVWCICFCAPRYRAIVVLWYLVYICLLSVMGDVESSYLLLPYVYKYVTIAVLARITDVYIR